MSSTVGFNTTSMGTPSHLHKQVTKDGASCPILSLLWRLKGNKLQETSGLKCKWREEEKERNKIPFLGRMCPEAWKTEHEYRDCSIASVCVCNSSAACVQLTEQWHELQSTNSVDNILTGPVKFMAHGDQGEWDCITYEMLQKASSLLQVRFLMSMYDCQPSWISTVSQMGSILTLKRKKKIKTKSPPMCCCKVCVISISK